MDLKETQKTFVTSPDELWSCKPLAVSAKNIYKSYNNGRSIVLTDFNMSVSSGIIYSLLGASGCGKTTALSLIVGILRPTYGSIEVYGKIPGSPECGVPGPAVGYMPQGISLYTNFTIREILLYFGRIYGLPESIIINKVESLSCILELSKLQDSRISSLSGGQQRRVSLAVALLHEPKLLILDEPTVGVDPLLRERIWNYLHRYVQELKSTVIITTHYIEETKDSHMIGIMRNGRMLLEESPKALLRKYNSQFLETIVTSLFRDASKSDKEDRFVFFSSATNLDEIVATSYSKLDSDFVSKSFTRTHPNALYRGNKNTHRKLKAVLIRNFISYMRNPLLVLICLLLPAFNGSLINSIIGVPPKNLRLSIVNPESNYSPSNCLQINNTSGNCSQFSCSFIQEISKSIVTPVFMQSQEEALESVKEGKSWGYIEFPENYSSSLINKYAFGNFPDNQSLLHSEISFRLDYSNALVGGILVGTMYESIQEVAFKNLVNCGLEDKKWAVELPLHFRQPVYEENPGSNAKLTSVAYLTLFCGCPMLLFAIFLNTERNDGTMFRNMVAGVSSTYNLISIVITGLNVIFMQILLTYFVCYTFLGYDLDVKGFHSSVITIFFLSGVYGQTLGLLLAYICTDVLEVIICGLGFYLFHLPLIGIIWPQEGSPEAIRHFTNLIPLKWATDALRSIITRGWTLSHPKIYPTIAILIGCTIAQLIVAIKLWRKV